MLLTKKLACPSCGVKLRVADTMPPGKMITCPKCGDGFPVPDGTDYTLSPKAAIVRSRKAATPPDEDEGQREEVAARPKIRKRRKKPKEAANNAPLILGLVIGGALSLIVGVALAVILRPWEKKAERIADSSPARPGPSESRPGPRAAPPELGPLARRPEGGGPGPGAGPGPAAPRPAAAPAPSGQGPAGAESDLIAVGQNVFQANDCARCHSIGGTSGGGMRGRRGPNLSRVGANPSHTVDWLVEQIRDPQSHRPDSRMPAYAGKISEDDLRALASYLASLK